MAPYLNLSLVEGVDAAQLGLEIIAQLEDFLGCADVAFAGVGGSQAVRTSDKQFRFQLGLQSG